VVLTNAISHIDMNINGIQCKQLQQLKYVENGANKMNIFLFYFVYRCLKMFMV
jgi:hypothetical protein